ncbi:hypothetical protein, conserved [Eimeria praecox]|uniref:Uncharacterized protein n=1 Tax=Eimeria praecox TaxID=51316 RepID=U6H536_9EIME|nr:hypothetical protein, conserved [Eimeria praecox]
MFIARSHQQPSRYNTDASYDEISSVASDKKEPAFASRRQARESFITDPRQRVLFTRTNSAEKQMNTSIEGKHHDVHQQEATAFPCSLGDSIDNQRVRKESVLARMAEWASMRRRSTCWLRNGV